MNITIFGLGYVGIINLVLLKHTLSKSKEYTISMVDNNDDKILSFNKSPNEYIKRYYPGELPDFLRCIKAFKNIPEKINVAVICLPTNSTESWNLDYGDIIFLIKKIRKINKDCLIIVRSTMPIGSLDDIADNQLIYLPEFFTEVKPLWLNDDNNKRIIIGVNDSISYNHLNISFITKYFNLGINTYIMNYKEAQLVKLATNAYLANRISFFNQIDTISKSLKLNVEKVLTGLKSDNRIGNVYNRTSSGFGGYCLEKDLKCLINNINCDHVLLHSILESNNNRIIYLIEIIKKKISMIRNNKIPFKIGFFRLTSNTNINRVINSKLKVIADNLQKYYKNDNEIYITIYEPAIDNLGEIYVINNGNYVDYINDNDLIISECLFDELVSFYGKKPMIIFSNCLDE